MEKVESAKQYYDSSKKIAIVACIICLLMTFLPVTRILNVDKDANIYDIDSILESSDSSENNESIIDSRDLEAIETLIFLGGGTLDDLKNFAVPQQFRRYGLQNWISYGLPLGIGINGDKMANTIELFMQRAKGGKAVEDYLLMAVLAAVAVIAIPLLVMLFDALGVHIVQVIIAACGVIYGFYYCVRMYFMTGSGLIYTMGWVPFLAPIAMLVLLGLSINCMVAKNEYKKAQLEALTPAQA